MSSPQPLLDRCRPTPLAGKHHGFHARKPRGGEWSVVRSAAAGQGHLGRI